MIEMAKIQFRSGKTKVKVFEKEKADSAEQKSSVLSDPEEVIPFPDEKPKQKEKPQESAKPEYRNETEVFEYLYSKLTMQYNIDTISVYQFSDKKSTDGRLHYRKIYSTELSKYEVEKFFGYSTPFIRTNATGFTDNRMHRARFIERFDDRLIVLSSSAYEVFRSEYDLQMIRYEIKTAFKEVEKF